MKLIYPQLKQLLVTKTIILFTLFLIAFTLISVQLSTAHAYHQVHFDPLGPTEEALRCEALDDHEVDNNDLICREIDTSVEDAALIGTADAPVIGRIGIPAAFPTEPNEIIASAITVIIGFTGLIFFIVFLLGGLRYLTAGGDEKATMAARQTLTNAFIGLVIVVASFLIAQILFAVFGLDALVNVI